ncbi:MAG: Fic family protein [Candidatus Omnitrophica bacterium]|nr:Fic family protein [Candidatus Omnitrophota bacterium]
MNIMELRKEIEKIRKNRADFINVSNLEWYSLFKDEIRNSIAIEGVFANRNDLLDVLERNKRTDSEKTASILGYFESASSMYEYAHNQHKEKEFVLKVSDVKQIHTLLMRYEKDMGIYLGDLGEYRKTNVEVASATFKPIDVYYVATAMNLLVKWVNSKIADKEFDPVTLVTISHIWFETVHPFRDGNGRVGRILLSYLLVGAGFVNIAIKGVAKSDREIYYNALEACDDCFERMHRDLEKKKKIVTKDVDRYMKDVDFDPLSKIIVKRLEDSVKRLRTISKDKLKGDAVLSLRELAETYNYSQNYLRNLINRGQLKAHKEGKLWYVRVRDMQKYMESIAKKSTL